MRSLLAALVLTPVVALAEPASTAPAQTLDFAEFGTAAIDLPTGWSVGVPRIDRFPTTSFITYATVSGRDDVLPLVVLLYAPPEMRAKLIERTEAVVTGTFEALARLGTYEPPQKAKTGELQYWTIRGVDAEQYANGRPEVLKVLFYRDGALVDATLSMRKRDAKLEASFRDALLGMRLKLADAAPPPAYRASSPGIVRIASRVPLLVSKAIAVERLASMGEPVDAPACGIQASILFESPELYVDSFGKAVETLHRSVRRDGRVHSVLYIRFEQPLREGAGSFVSALLYGGDGKPTSMHPELAVLFDDAIAIVCGGPRSPLLTETLNQALR